VSPTEWLSDRLAEVGVARQRGRGGEKWWPIILCIVLCGIYTRIFVVLYWEGRVRKNGEPREWKITKAIDQPPRLEGNGFSATHRHPISR